jgi:hypothetical protein
MGITTSQTVFSPKYLFSPLKNFALLPFAMSSDIVVIGLLFILVRVSLLQANGITFFSLATCRIYFSGASKPRLTDIPSSCMGQSEYIPQLSNALWTK